MSRWLPPARAASRDVRSSTTSSTEVYALSGQFGLLDPAIWRRRGRGLTAEVGFVSWESVQSALRQLPSEWAPYWLLNVRNEKALKGYQEVGRRVQPQQLDVLPEGVRWQNFVVSSVLSDELDSLDWTVPHLCHSGALAVSGLPVLHYRLVLRGVESPSSVGCTTAAETLDGSARLVHREYARVHGEFVRALRSYDVPR